MPLDKRLAADGRGLQQVHINENFAKMAEALSIAERTAREAVEARSQMERRRAQIKKQEQEQRMREMALNARLLLCCKKINRIYLVLTKLFLMHTYSAV